MSKKAFKVSYDPDADVLYLARRGEEEEFQEIAPGVGIELDGKGTVIGIELLKASDILKGVINPIWQRAWKGGKITDTDTMVTMVTMLEKMGKSLPCPEPEENEPDYLKRALHMEMSKLVKELPGSKWEIHPGGKKIERSRWVIRGEKQPDYILTSDAGDCIVCQCKLIKKPISDENDVIEMLMGQCVVGAYLFNASGTLAVLLDSGEVLAEREKVINELKAYLSAALGIYLAWVRIPTSD